MNVNFTFYFIYNYKIYEKLGDFKISRKYMNQP